MKSSDLLDRRHFLKTTALTSATLAVATMAAPGATRPATFITAPAKMKLGTVTYNLAKDWDLATLIKNCQAAKFQGVELRTTHAHGVEVSLSKAERDEVRQRFTDTGVELMGLGSAFDYHTPDQDKLRRDIAATKEYIILAHDVGAPGIKVRPNGLPKEVPVEKTLAQIGKALRELGLFADGYGVQLRLEVHGSGTSLLPNIKTIMDAADHKAVGVCWNSNDTDLEGEGFDHNFNLVKDRIFTVHMRDLSLENYPFRRLLKRLNEIGYEGFCLAEIPESKEPIRLMQYYRSLWLAYQDLL